MERHLRQLPGPIFALIREAGELSRAKGVKAYLIGGFVRDLLMRRANFDLDIAVEGQGIEFAEEFKRRVGGRLVRHRRFGTATVTVVEELARGRILHKVDFSTARREKYPHPGSLPVVSPGSLRDDLYRRDFTINTLAIGLARPHFGELIDLFGARVDIRGKKIRVLHDQSFIDDPTRVLRGIRFEQRFGFRIEPHTLGLLRQAVAAGLVSSVQPHRLRDEIILMLKESRPEDVLARLKELAGLDLIHPQIEFTKQTIADFLRIREAAAWFGKNFPSRHQPEGWLMYLMRLVQPLSVPQAKSLCLKFAFGKNDARRLMEYIHASSVVTAALGHREAAPSRVFRLLKPLSIEALLLVKSQSGRSPAAGHIAAFLREYHAAALSVSGHDLKELGIQPGPLYQKILKGLLDAKLDGRIRTRAEELRLAESWKDSNIHSQERE